MKNYRYIFFIILLLLISGVDAQQIIGDVQVELTPSQKKHDPSYGFVNKKTGGLTIFFEPQTAPFEKGEPIKYERYELQLDKDLNIFSGDFRTLDAWYSLQPKIFWNETSIGYYIWLNKKAGKETGFIVLQIIKYDNDNNITATKSIELCDEKEFESYKISSYNGSLLIFYSMEVKTVKENKISKVAHFFYKRIDIASLNITDEYELNLIANEELGLESVLVENDKIFFICPELTQTDSNFIKIPKSWLVFKLNLDGTVDKINEIALPGSGATIGSAYLSIYKDEIYIVGEYGISNDMLKTPKPPYGSSTSATIKCTNPFMGIYLKKLGADLQEKTSVFYSYKDDILPKIKKGNKSFIKKSINLHFEQFYFTNDGSFYVTAETYNKTYRINGADNVSANFTEFNYLDGLVFKFNSSLNLDWFIELDKISYSKIYPYYIKEKKPFENGRLSTFMTPSFNLAVFYNAVGKEYRLNRYGFNHVLISAAGVMSNPVDLSNNQQFELIDGGIIDIGNNEIFAVGTHAQSKNIWIRWLKIKE
jgi:hypothetical protein